MINNNLHNKIDNCIAVVSGKGGVGKSTIAVNLALAYVGQGLNTAILDANVWGSSIPILFGLENHRIDLTSVHSKIIPVEKFGIKILSSCFFESPEQNNRITGMDASKALLKYYFEAEWGEIDVMIIDMPSGAGDVLAILCDQIKPNKTIVVTTPQKLAFSEAHHIGLMFNNEERKLPLTGVVENMSWFSPVEDSTQLHYLFGKGGGQVLAGLLETKLLAQIPFAQGLAQSADEGKLLTYAQNSITIPIFHKLAFDVLGED
ncbi:MAG: P-loop NTPase [Bacteroidota bacterium]